jgi:ferredoxin/flavodoxin---NADP+ reductase
LLDIKPALPRQRHASLIDGARMNPFHEARVRSVRHWTDRLFSFTTTREDGFRFLSGQFVMIGLNVDGRPLMRAYSIASSPYEPSLEFLSIKVPEGPLTSRLQHIMPGDTVLVGRKPTGTLLLQNLKRGRNLYLLASGTGLAPFMSIVRDPGAYECFDRIVLVHGCRLASELAYDDYLREELPVDPYFGQLANHQLLYYPTVTREAYRHQGRIPALLESGRLVSDLSLPALDPAHDRCMVCGSPAMLADTRGLLERLGFEEGSMARQGSYVIERAFVDR